ncbi:3-oxoacyl-[acyl-carrier-protein] synthase [Formosa agariphila KMM 3901]|uniref:3-oxoacyl-[acyl-carrier-protein] synthase n=1 Tax=Formosa agariphila (strain DSM 15362 / KCTC 12365 / LMG 23005 / KMM 3901 / M-2Alg 35-1) TaxID=1347342 RepID=T2KHB9_FORAG|nr:ketoacyl-ACP synthase III [Formosa agariphila]CDF78242.1 3-oxoacyl-[acyl-carrier-protein] synthase [Formosa agariphila KMM 3901]
MNIKITGTGSYIPSIVQENDKFLNHSFLNNDGTPFENDNTVIIDKFKSITGISERRYVKEEFTSSDIGFLAAEKAIANANIDPETIDYIVFAHNFGDMPYGSNQSDMLPGLAVRVKHKLKIKNPKCVAYDLLFGCPGWIEGVIQAQAFIKAGIAKRCLVIGSETLSRVVDKHDRDAMIFSDGAGACILEETSEPGGILSHVTESYTLDNAFHLSYGKSFNTDLDETTKYIKMDGRKIYEFALTHVPAAMKACLDASGYDIIDVKKVFIHQANEKMDDAILKRFYRLFKMKTPENIMPMTIGNLGNSSVATVPTLFDIVRHNKLENHSLNTGDVIIFASVGAGMHINAIVYKY